MFPFAKNRVSDLPSAAQALKKLSPAGITHRQRGLSRYMEVRQIRKGASMKLLLAEDELEYSRALVAILEHNHYAVDAVYNGNDVQDYVTSGSYDGIILDWMMPGMDGISVIHALRNRGIHIPVLMLTAKTQVEDRITGYDAGADDYLPKPFITAELLARVRAMLRRSGNFTGEILHVGTASLNCTTCELSGPAGTIRLNGKEYQLAELLLRNQQAVFSTEQIMEHIWGWNAGAEINVVWTNISMLRKKLHAIGSNLEIAVKRGVGYYLEVRDTVQRKEG